MTTASHRCYHLPRVLLMASKALGEAALARGATRSFEMRGNCGQEAEGWQERELGPWTGSGGGGRMRAIWDIGVILSSPKVFLMPSPASSPHFARSRVCCSPQYTDENMGAQRGLGT